MRFVEYFLQYATHSVKLSPQKKMGSNSLNTENQIFRIKGKLFVYFKIDFLKEIIFSNQITLSCLNGQ